MTLGVGGSTMEAELGRMRSMREGVAPIGDDELRARVAKAQSIMRREGIQALHLDSSTSCLYFTGLRFKLTERLHGVVIPAEGDLTYVSPAFEAERLRTMMRLPGEVRCWEEHDSPTALAIDVVRDMGYPSGTIAVDPVDALLHLRRSAPGRQLLQLRQRRDRDRGLPDDQVAGGNRPDHGAPWS